MKRLSLLALLLPLLALLPCVGRADVSATAPPLRSGTDAAKPTTLGNGASYWATDTHNLYLGAGGTPTLVNTPLTLAGIEAALGFAPQPALGFTPVDAALLGTTLPTTNVSVSGVLRGINGTGTDSPGSDLTLTGGTGTGSGTPGAVVIKASAAGASGATQQTAQEVGRFTAAGLQTPSIISSANNQPVILRQLSADDGGSYALKVFNGGNEQVFAVGYGGNSFVPGVSNAGNFQVTGGGAIFRAGYAPLPIYCPNIISDSPSKVPLTVTLSAGQTANGIELNSATGTGGDVFRVDAGGNVTATGAPTFAGLVVDNTAQTVAVGRLASVSNGYGVALGPSASAGYLATGIGSYSTASGNSSVALGAAAAATATNAVAIGANTTNSTANTCKIGYDVIAPGYSAACRTVSANDTATLADTNLFVNGAYTETLPTSGVPSGRQFVIKNISASAATLTNTVDGTAGYSLPAGSAVTVVWSGSAYYAISKY